MYFSVIFSFLCFYFKIMSEAVQQEEPSLTKSSQKQEQQVPSLLVQTYSKLCINNKRLILVVFSILVAVYIIIHLLNFSNTSEPNKLSNQNDKAAHLLAVLEKLIRAIQPFVAIGAVKHNATQEGTWA
jgi:Na+-transporting methylmalonyl-CoA/oxaloacetate decarboxylase gamma subunit